MNYSLPIDLHGLVCDLIGYLVLGSGNVTSDKENLSSF